MRLWYSQSPFCTCSIVTGNELYNCWISVILCFLAVTLQCSAWIISNTILGHQCNKQIHPIFVKCFIFLCIQNRPVSRCCCGSFLQSLTLWAFRSLVRGMWDARAVCFHKSWGQSHSSHLVLDTPRDSSALGLVTTEHFLSLCWVISHGGQLMGFTTFKFYCSLYVLHCLP